MDVLSPFISVLPVLLDKSRQVEEQYSNGKCVENMQEISWEFEICVGKISIPITDDTVAEN